MPPKIYRLYSLTTAIDLLRPNAKWETDGRKFTKWDDPRPMPDWKEVLEVAEKLKRFEDSLNTIWTEEQLKYIIELKEKVFNKGNVPFYRIPDLKPLDEFRPHRDLDLDLDLI